MARDSAVVLLSAGLDSSYNLFRAAHDFDVRLTLTFDYGQKASAREIERSAALASSRGVRHRVIDLTWFRDFTRTALVGEGAVPVDVDLDDAADTRASAARVWVPNRNGILLNIAAGFAEGLGASYVIPGFNLEEANTFPDNSVEFLSALDASLLLSTASAVRTLCFSTAMDKRAIVADALMFGVPFARLWPCYESGARWCGACESCRRFARALAANGLSFAELRDAD